MSAAVAVAYAPVRERKISDSDKLIRTICLEVQPMTRETFAELTRAGLSMRVAYEDPKRLWVTKP